MRIKTTRTPLFAVSFILTIEPTHTAGRGFIQNQTEWVRRQDFKGGSIPLQSLRLLRSTLDG
jgi:hypothetical protein